MAVAESIWSPPSSTSLDGGHDVDPNPSHPFIFQGLRLHNIVPRSNGFLSPGLLDLPKLFPSRPPRIDFFHTPLRHSLAAFCI